MFMKTKRFKVKKKLNICNKYMYISINPIEWSVFSVNFYFNLQHCYKMKKHCNVVIKK